MAVDPDDETFFKDLGLAIVTLGFYMPYWMWRKNQDLVDALPTLRLPNNGWLLSGGAAVAMAARWLLSTPVIFLEEETLTDRVPPAVVATAGIIVFLVGVYFFTRNLERAADHLGIPRPDPSWWFPTTMSLVFIGIEAGNVFESWLLRGPVLAAYFALPYFFYRAHRDFARIEEAALRRLAGAPPAPPAGSPVPTSGPTATRWSGR